MYFAIKVTLCNKKTETLAAFQLVLSMKSIFLFNYPLYEDFFFNKTKNVDTPINKPAVWKKILNPNWVISNALIENTSFTGDFSDCFSCKY